MLSLNRKKMQHTVSKMAHETAVMEHDIAGYLRSHQNFVVTFIVLTDMLEFCIYFSCNLATNALVNTVSESRKTYKQASNAII
jgi:hypothetical protein